MVEKNPSERGPEEFIKKELTPAEQIQGLLEAGFRVTHVFSIEQNAAFEDYIEELKKSGKEPGIDFKFVIDNSLEGSVNFKTGKPYSTVTKVLEKE